MGVEPGRGMGVEPGPGVRIGVDDWVAEADARTQRRAGPLGSARGALDRVGQGWRLAVLVAVVAAVPVLGGSQFVIRVGINALLFALLALGLNVIVGEAGLLDLGYIAFYGFGAYCYALLSSNQFHLHWPSEATILLVTVATAGLGLLLGLPSGRLLGDYLAIVTLFFGQMFVQLATNLDRLQPPWASKPLNITGGPNGIFGVDPIRIGPVHLISQEDYFYLLLGLLTVALVALHRLVDSRTGRAWRALREDATAAELAGIPVRRLKLFAFAVGGAIAGLSGTAFAAVQLGVFPQNFDLTLLIMIYAAVVLGGAGSLPGVLVGAAVISVVPEILRDPEHGRLLFYGVLLVLLLARVRPWWRPLALLAATVALGVVIRLLAEAVWPDAVAAAGAGSDALGRVLGAWVVVPARPVAIGNAAFVLLVAAVLTLTRLQNAGHVSVPRPGSPAATSGGDGAHRGYVTGVLGTARTVALVPVLWLAAFVWESRLADQPSITRQLLLGAILVVMMNARPHGLLGRPRVEAV
jgi:branched-chain amino acid transport system permease protein